MSTGVITNLGSKARRATNRASREAVQRIPILRGRDERRRQEWRDTHLSKLPGLDAIGAEHLRRMQEVGVSITTLDDLCLVNTDRFEQVLTDLVDTLKTRLSSGESTVHVTNDEVADDPTIWQWGLDEQLLDLVENYLGLPPRYYGADVRCELADSRTFEVRQWHRDVEDDRLFKILIWINDVDIDTGPFEFVDRVRSESATTLLSYVSGFVSDDRLATAVDRAQWQPAVGPAWTAVFADTASVFHRAKPPTKHKRFSVTFTYSSWHPRKQYPKIPFSDAQQARIRAGLSARQAACLPDVIGN